ncbi:mRNA-capping enzyme subunit beta [Psilocybe cubensis]|uniref:mRNA-capping enzyme subunit beta n=2 Tax=Psilocybe cubensis TaxID=181762 RepID=A0ACB8GZF6_PSICU|nr:mRNA-capping enzyme subunit beta [Psilocybe cubensis]KAH9480350.1 mRNA-capping enzyme subunit beta [Psilocybe cubensis]
MQPRSSSPPPLKRARRTLTDSPPYPTSSDPHSTNGHASTSASSSSNTTTSLPPLSLSILGVEPLDEFIKEIADFIHHMIVTRPYAHEYPAARVEVEAKIGLLRDRATGGRVVLPVLVETILAPGATDTRFESNMSLHQHKHFNTLLNKLKMESPSGASPLGYSHLYLIDSFYAFDPSSSSGAGASSSSSSSGGMGMGGGGERGERGEKVRVTTDEKTKAVIECVRKVRLGDLNVYSPKREADWRVSVNLEIPVPRPTGTSTHTRRKDRISYSHEEFKIDLTQVTSSMSPNAPPQTLHELELEIARPDFLLATALKRGDPAAPEHERSAFDELIRAFVNNARILVRNSGEGWQ